MIEDWDLKWSFGIENFSEDLEIGIYGWVEMGVVLVWGLGLWGLMGCFGNEELRDLMGLKIELELVLGKFIFLFLWFMVYGYLNLGIL